MVLVHVGRREVRDARCPRWVSIRDAASYSPDIRCRRGFSIGDFSTIFAQKVQCATDPRPLALQIAVKRWNLDDTHCPPPYVLVGQEEELLVRCQRLCPSEKTRSVARSLAQDPSESRGTCTLATGASYI